MRGDEQRRFELDELLNELKKRILKADLPHDFKEVLLADAELALKCLEKRDFLCVLNVLGVIFDKLVAFLLKRPDLCEVIIPLLALINKIQQILLRLRVVGRLRHRSDVDRPPVPLAPERRPDGSSGVTAPRSDGLSNDRPAGAGATGPIGAVGADRCNGSSRGHRRHWSNRPGRGNGCDRPDWGDRGDRANGSWCTGDLCLYL